MRFLFPTILFALWLCLGIQATPAQRASTGLKVPAATLNNTVWLLTFSPSSSGAQGAQGADSTISLVRCPLPATKKLVPKMGTTYLSFLNGRYKYLRGTCFEQDGTYRITELSTLLFIEGVSGMGSDCTEPPSLAGEWNIGYNDSGRLQLSRPSPIFESPRSDNSTADTTLTR